MHWSEIIAIVVVVAILGAYLGVYIYRRTKKSPFHTCECGESKGAALLKAYRKKYKKNRCGCQKASKMN